MVPLVSLPAQILEVSSAVLPPPLQAPLFAPIEPGRRSEFFSQKDKDSARRREGADDGKERARASAGAKLGGKTLGALIALASEVSVRTPLPRAITAVYRQRVGGAGSDALPAPETYEDDSAFAEEGTEVSAGSDAPWRSSSFGFRLEPFHVRIAQRNYGQAQKAVRRYFTGLVQGESLDFVA